MRAGWRASSLADCDYLLCLLQNLRIWKPGWQCAFPPIHRHERHGVPGHYYFTVRAGNVVSLRKLVNGAIHELDRASYTVDGARWYQLRFEAIGHSLRAHIDGLLVPEATNDTFQALAASEALRKESLLLQQVPRW